MSRIHHARHLAAVIVSTALLQYLAACSSEPRAVADEGADSARMIVRSDSTDSTRARGLHSDSMAGVPAARGVNGVVLPSATSDTVLANIIAVVDRGEVEAGELAITKARNTPVKDYARAMIEAHTRDLAAITRLMRQSQLAVTDSAITPAQQNPSGSPVMELMQQHRETMESLRSATRERFDLAYMDAMVAGHQGLLQLLQQNSGAASSEPLKAHLASVVLLVTDHLTRAKVIQASLASAAAAAVPR
jgi:putative membrane protein